jgi:hypothetical protein
MTVDHKAFYQMASAAVLGAVLAFFMPTLKLGDVAGSIQELRAEIRIMNQRIDFLLANLNQRIDEMDRRLQNLEEQNRKILSPDKSSAINMVVEDEWKPAPLPPDPLDPKSPKPIPANDYGIPSKPVWPLKG